MRTFTGDPGWVTTDQAGNVISGIRYTVWTAETGGAQISGLLSPNGAPLPGYVETDALGRTRFKIDGDTYGVVWLQTPAGDRWRLVSNEVLAQLSDSIGYATDALEQADQVRDLVDALTPAVTAATTASLSAQALASQAFNRVEQFVPPVDAQPGFDVIPLIGQSNMVGRGIGLETLLDEGAPRVFTFGATGTDANRIVPASESLQHWDTIAGRVGPGLEFARQYILTRPANRKVLLVPCAHGATGFTAGVKRWKVDHTPAYANLFELAVRQIKNAVTAAGAYAILPGFVWHQGEADGPTNYAANLDTMINALRARLNVPDAWFLIGQMCTAGFFATVKIGVNDIHMRTPIRLERTAFAYSRPQHNPDDTTHLSAIGERTLGRSLASVVALARNNVTGAPLAPPPRVWQVLGEPGTVRVQWQRPSCRFDDFLVETRPNGQEGPWTVVERPAGPDSEITIPATVPTDVRVSTGWLGQFSDPTVSLRRLPSKILLSGKVGPNRAYALRRVREAYAGPAVRVRRSTDSTETDIGFDTAGNLDLDALRAFAGAGSAFVRTWYDQAASPASLVQPTAANQPRIVNAGEVVIEDGRPAMIFDGTTSYLYSTTPTLASAASLTALMVMRLSGSADGSPRIFSEGNTGDTAPIYTMSINANLTASTQWRGNGETSASTVTSDFPAIQPRLQVLGLTDTGNQVRFLTDLREGDPQTRTRTGATQTLNRFALGAFYRTTVDMFAPMRLCEAIFWTNDLPDDQRRDLIGNQLEHHNSSLIGWDR